MKQTEVNSWLQRMDAKESLLVARRAVRLAIISVGVASGAIAITIANLLLR